jgi:hypothetical protein
VSVLGKPQHEWDEFLEEARKPRRRWTLGRILLVALPVAVVVAILIYRYGG